MDSPESTKIVYSRIQKVEPELASKIVGFLLFHENGNCLMIRLAFSPDNVILSITNRVKTELGFISPNQTSFHQNADIPQLQLSNRFCNHGINCRFLHGNLNEGFIRDQLFSSGSLKMLEMELTNLLRSRNGVPISISSLPFLYEFKYGKPLSCNAGFTLIELLACMTSSIRLLEIGHGQHLVLLAEDLPKYMEYKTEHSGTAARQIYLTFPAESTFTEQEVLYHFNKYGPVKDVRLPYQQKRMFGFVTFVFPETVTMVLERGNPHFIDGARVLVKPYKEKARSDDRNNPNGKKPTSLDGDSKSQDISRTNNGKRRHVKKNAVEENTVELETERKRLSEFQLVPKGMSNGHSNGMGNPSANKELDA